MAPLSWRQALVASAVGVGGALALRLLRGFPWSLAAVVGLAMAVLAVSAWRTAERLRRAWSDDDAERRGGG